MLATLNRSHLERGPKREGWPATPWENGGLLPLDSPTSSAVRTSHGSPSSGPTPPCDDHIFLCELDSGCDEQGEARNGSLTRDLIVIFSDGLCAMCLATCVSRSFELIQACVQCNAYLFE
jgi:hypothetical protein